MQERYRLCLRYSEDLPTLVSHEQSHWEHKNIRKAKERHLSCQRQLAVFCTIIFLILSKWKESPTTEKTTHFVFTTNRHCGNLAPIYYSCLYLNTSANALFWSRLKAWTIRGSNPDWDKKIFFPPKLPEGLWGPKQPSHETKNAEVNNGHSYTCTSSGSYVMLCSDVLYWW
jgi:hypothetical protein